MMGDAVALRATLEPTVERLGYELVYVTLVESKTRLLRVFIDAPGGITLGDCERVSRLLSDVLDIEGLINGEYTLEVSSPGLDRPLAKKEHFERARGKQVSIQMRESHSGRKKFKGSVVEVEEDAASIEVNGERFKLHFSQIQRANLVSSAPLNKEELEARRGNNG